MELKPDFWIAEVHDAEYDLALIDNTVKFFETFTEARNWLAETCKARAIELYQRGEICEKTSLYGALGHYYLGHIVSHYTWNGYLHEYDTKEYQLECDSLYRMVYPRNDGSDWGNLFEVMPYDEVIWLKKYTAPDNKKNVYHYDYKHERAYKILTDKLIWDSKNREWKESIDGR